MRLTVLNHRKLVTTARAVLAPLAVVGLVLLGSLLDRPSAPMGADATTTEFSAGRAAEHVAATSRAPHPTGSSENARVRDYLVRTLVGLGLEVDQRPARVVNDLGATPYGGQFRSSAIVTNVVATLRATVTEPLPGAVLVAAHHDSVPRGRGVHDNGMSVAAVLEAVRVVAAEERHRDLVVLFSDGEEFGLLGARAFVDDPASEDVATVLNADSRGGGGPSIMYESGPRSAKLVHAWAKAVPEPRTSSLFDALYAVMPNSTDFTELTASGQPGLNFANIGDFTDYHSPTETIEDLDQATLQHHGENILGGLRVSLGPQTNLAEEPSAFFTLPGGVFVSYSAEVSLGLATLTVLAAVFAMVRVVSRYRITGRDILIAVAWVVLSLVTLGGIGFTIPAVFLKGDGHIALWGTPDPAWPAWATVWWAAAAIAVAGPQLLRRVRPLAVVVVTTSIMTGITLFLVVLAPGAAYLSMMWAVGLIATLGRALTPSTTVRFALATLAVLILGFSVGPVVLLAQDAFGVAGAAMISPLVGLLLSATTALVRLPDLPCKVILPTTVVPVIAAAAAVTLWIRGPQPADLLYVSNTDSKRATWAAVNDDSPAAQRLNLLPDQRLPQIFPGWTRTFATADAGAATLDAPTARILDVRTEGAHQVVNVELRSVRAARDLVLLSRRSPVHQVSVDGVPAAHPTSSAADEWWELWLWSQGATPVRVTLTTEPGDLELIIADRTDGVPGPPTDLTAPAIDIAFFSNSTYTSDRMNVNSNSRTLTNDPVPTSEAHS